MFVLCRCAESHIDVMLTGVTGAGKSSACNFILQVKEFNVGAGMVCVTPKSHQYEKEINGTEVRLIDTPGFCDDFETDEERIDEFGNAIFHAKDGLHAIALVINANHRFTASEAKVLQDIERLGELWPFMFIIFTAASVYGTSDEDQRRAINDNLSHPRCPKHFKFVMDKVGNRFMTLECQNSSDEYYKRKVEEFLSMVDQIYFANKKLYTN